jgi:hypothetical protein
MQRCYILMVHVTGNASWVEEEVNGTGNCLCSAFMAESCLFSSVLYIADKA